jgi:hypothetical protein
MTVSRTRSGHLESISLTPDELLVVALKARALCEARPDIEPQTALNMALIELFAPLGDACSCCGVKLMPSILITFAPLPMPRLVPSTEASE